MRCCHKYSFNYSILCQVQLLYFSNGVGRTGIFIAVDRLIQQAREEKTVDVCSVILDMRNNRCNMVKTEVRMIIS